MLEFLGFIFICTLIVGMIFFVVYAICTLRDHDDDLREHYRRLNDIENKIWYNDEDDEKDQKE